MGLYSVFLGVGQLIGTSAGGYFADWNGVDGLVLLSAILGGITGASLLALRRREISDRNGEQLRLSLKSKSMDISSKI
jgi:MFS family permease